MTCWVPAGGAGASSTRRQALSAGAGKPESGKLIRNGARWASSVRTRSMPSDDGSPGRALYFGCVRRTWRSEAPRFENTNSSVAVSTFVSRSGNAVSAAPGCPGAAGAPAGATAAASSGGGAALLASVDACCAGGAGGGGGGEKNFAHTTRITPHRTIAHIVRLSTGYP